ncbi:hypothetical protein D9M71_757460 [compost metagenome]
MLVDEAMGTGFHTAYRYVSGDLSGQHNDFYWHALGCQAADDRQPINLWQPYVENHCSWLMFMDEGQSIRSVFRFTHNRVTLILQQAANGHADDWMVIDYYNLLIHCAATG